MDEKHALAIFVPGSALEMWRALVSIIPENCSYG
jgi:hypothetical protein